ncbi:hypothetical protein B0H10DRAFT_2216378 [Mycena sp. CBHHK59/15]|nr:hypothetical protein B0H10DRAFT_2216378 [Mycena sp. CBHHK59/15]
MHNYRTITRARVDERLHIDEKHDVRRRTCPDTAVPSPAQYELVTLLGHGTERKRLAGKTESPQRTRRRRRAVSVAFLPPSCACSAWVPEASFTTV